MTKDTFGPTSGKQFAYYDHDSQSWKMWPATGLWGSIEFSETWPRTGRMSGGRAYELPTSVPPITGNGFLSSRHFPTPKAHDGIMGRPRTSGRPIEKSTHLGTIVTLLPTPAASDWKRDDHPAHRKRKSPGITTVSVHFPTPRASDANGPGHHGQGGPDLRTAITELWSGETMPPLFEMEE